MVSYLSLFSKCTSEDADEQAMTTARGWFIGEDSDGFIPPLPPTPRIPPPPSDSEPGSPAVNSRNSPAQSPASSLPSSSPSSPGIDLALLEERRLQLLKELQAAADESSQEWTVVSSLEDEAEEEETVIQENGCGANARKKPTQVGTVVELSEEGISADMVAMQASPMSCRSISIELGTPVLSQQPVTPLPASSSFASGISEHLPHENLPGAAGTFTRMKKVLAQIREKFKNL